MSYRKKMNLTPTFSTGSYLDSTVTAITTGAD